MLDRNTRNYLTVYKRMSSDSFKNLQNEFTNHLKYVKTGFDIK